MSDLACSQDQEIPCRMAVDLKLDYLALQAFV